jgi:hypothetical protein
MKVAQMGDFFPLIRPVVEYLTGNPKFKSLNPAIGKW